MEGARLVNTPYDIKFRVDKENELLCSRELTAKDLQRFRKAVKKEYYFQVGGIEHCILAQLACTALMHATACTT